MKVTLRRILLVSSLMLISGLTACKCGSEKEKKVETTTKSVARDYESTVSKLGEAKQIDLARLIPADVDLALLAKHPDKLYAYLQKKPWWKEVKSSPVLQDLYLSRPLTRLSSMRHRLASLSPVQFKMPKLKDLLSTPLAFAQRKTEDGSSLLIVKQIDLRIQALDRLAEVFNQINEKDKAKLETIDGIKVRSIDLGSKKPLNYVVFSNLMLLSDDKKMLQESLALASGQKIGASLAGIEHGSMDSEMGKMDMELLLRPQKYPLAEFISPSKLLRLGWTAEHAKAIKIAGIATEDGSGASAFKRPDEILGWLPLESRVVIGRTGFDAVKTWGKLLAVLRKKDKGKLPSQLGDLERILEKTGKKLLLVLTDINPMEPAFVGFLELKDPKADSPWVEKNVAQELEFITGVKAEKLEPEGLGKSFTVWSAKSGVLSPSFVVTDGWLVFASSRMALVQVLKSMAGKAPSLKDRAGVKENMAKGDGTLGMFFINFDEVFHDLVKNSQKIISSSERFDANDLNSTWIPFFTALSKMGSLGGSWSQGGATIKGQVLAL